MRLLYADIDPSNPALLSQPGSRGSKFRRSLSSQQHPPETFSAQVYLDGKAAGRVFFFLLSYTALCRKVLNK